MSTQPVPATLDRAPAQPAPLADPRLAPTVDVAAPAVVADRDPMRHLRPDGSGGIELLWHERKVESFDTLQRITVPMLAGHLPASLPTDLSVMLGHLWVGRGTLEPNAAVTSVVAEIQHGLGSEALVLLVTTDCDLAEQNVVALHMIRDLRRALRDLHLRWVPGSDLLSA